MNEKFITKYLVIISSLSFLLLLYSAFFVFTCEKYDFQTPALLGDFIGGVLGTILTAIAAVFVYNTYLTQREQLEQQKKEANQILIDKLYDRISTDIDGLEITFYKVEENEQQPQLKIYKGIFVLYNFKELYTYDNTVLNQLNLILISFEHLFSLTKKATYKWEMQKQVNMDRNYLLLYTKILWPFHRFYSQEWDKLVLAWSPPHPDSLGTKTRFEGLFVESYEYLLDRKLVGIPEDPVYRKLLGKS